jgi:hypothetical protein
MRKHDRLANRDEARVVAYSWHGGMCSDLYAFASTGCIQSEVHRSGVLYELNRAMEDADSTNWLSPHWLHWLTATVRYVEVVPIMVNWLKMPEIPDSTFKYIENDPGEVMTLLTAEE